MKQPDKRQIAGWIALGLSLVITCFWAFWGIIENFHEGWYYPSLFSNLGLMLAQYLSPMLIFVAVTVVSILLPRIGGVLHVILALFATWFFGAFADPVIFLITLPLFALGSLYWFGRPAPRKVALLLAAGLPALTLVLAGVGPALRVSQRIDDGSVQARQVRGNGVTLVWAPEGPGWPRSGADWYEARNACRHLGVDGLDLSPGPQDIWRLPTVNEVVRSMARHGQNSGGVWDAQSAEASYETTPDKESPLWNVHSQVIYWWTATEIDEEHAYIIVYDGQVWSRSKDLSRAYLGFRCVKEATAGAPAEAFPEFTLVDTPCTAWHTGGIGSSSRSVKAGHAAVPDFADKTVYAARAGQPGPAPAPARAVERRDRPQTVVHDALTFLLEHMPPQMHLVIATRAFMASYRSDALGVIPHARKALAYLPEEDITWGGAAAVALGDAYIYEGRYVKAHRTYLDALRALERALGVVPTE